MINTTNLLKLSKFSNGNSSPSAPPRNIISVKRQSMLVLILVNLLIHSWRQRHLECFNFTPLFVFAFCFFISHNDLSDDLAISQWIMIFGNCFMIKNDLDCSSGIWFFVDRPSLAPRSSGRIQIIVQFTVDVQQGFFDFVSVDHILQCRITNQLIHILSPSKWSSVLTRMIFVSSLAMNCLFSPLCFFCLSEKERMAGICSWSYSKPIEPSRNRNDNWKALSKVFIMLSGSMINL